MGERVGGGLVVYRGEPAPSIAWRKQKAQEAAELRIRLRRTKRAEAIDTAFILGIPLSAALLVACSTVNPELAQAGVNLPLNLLAEQFVLGSPALMAVFAGAWGIRRTLREHGSGSLQERLDYLTG